MLNLAVFSAHAMEGNKSDVVGFYLGKKAIVGRVEQVNGRISRLDQGTLSIGAGLERDITLRRRATRKNGNLARLLKDHARHISPDPTHSRRICDVLSPSLDRLRRFLTIRYLIV